MQKELHPAYREKATMTCSCGTVFTIGSTEETLAIEICSQCHPFYTGKKKTVDTMGRVDRFKKMAEKAKEKQAETEKTQAEKKKRAAARKPKADETKRKVVSKKKAAKK